MTGTVSDRTALDAFSALAQETRLSVFRRLVRVGKGGLPAGAIAVAEGVPPSTLSSHLAQLERAGLVRSWRVDRRIFYAVDPQGVRGLIGYLIEDCCDGRPELCAPSVTPEEAIDDTCEEDRDHGERHDQG